MMTHRACPPLSWISMHGISVALAVTWLSHNSQYILYPGVVSYSKKHHGFLDPLGQMMVLKGSLSPCRLIQLRSKRTSVHSPCTEKKGACRSFSKPSSFLTEHKCCMQSNPRITGTPWTVFTRTVLESNHLKFSSYSID